MCVYIINCFFKNVFSGLSKLVQMFEVALLSNNSGTHVSPISLGWKPHLKNQLMTPLLFGHDLVHGTIPQKNSPLTLLVIAPLDQLVLQLSNALVMKMSTQVKLKFKYFCKVAFELSLYPLFTLLWVSRPYYLKTQYVY